MKRLKYSVGTDIGGVGANLMGGIMSLFEALGQKETYNSQPVTAQDQAVVPIFAMGGRAGQVPIEVEDDEVLETPDGSIAKVNGDTHEEGGEDMDVPQGTKIFSDRIKIDGKTMAERKTNREKTEARIKKLADKNPTDQLLKNSLKRTLEVNAMEEAEDMEIQKAAKQAIQSVREKFASGGIAGDETSYIQYDEFGNPITAEQAYTNPGVSMTDNQQVPIFNWGFNENYQNVAPSTVPATASAKTPSTNKSASGFTLGDTVGMAGNIFGALAPLMNTFQNRKGDTPNVNSFRNFGEDALDANRESQGYVGTQKQHAEEDLKIQKNTAKASNRNSARSVNTIRALDLATELGYGKGTNQIYDTFAKQMMTMLGQKSELENVQDIYVMSEEAKRDQADRADRDNFYANRGADFANLGTNIQGIGKNLNTHKGNQDMVDLLAQLSKYGLNYTRDKNGKLILE